MKIDFKNIKSKAAPTIKFVRHNLKVIFAVLVVGIYSFLIVRISLLSRAEPSQDQIDEVLQDVKKPQVDKSAVAKIQQLEDQNVEVQTLFQQARNNPFSE